VRHRVYGKHLSRDKNQRTALFKSLVGSLFSYGSIETTESKAKAVKGLIDKIINQAKTSNTQRLVSSYLVNKQSSRKTI
jgi:large subunit ribosomal protein L17